MVQASHIVRAGKGRKHIDFLKEEEDSPDHSRKPPKRHNNTRKYNSKQSNLNMGFTMDNINELDEDSFQEDAAEKSLMNWDSKRSFSEQTQRETSESKGDMLNLSEFNKNYDKKLSSNLYISISRKISSLKQTLNKKKKNTLRENKKEYIEELQQIIGRQRKKIDILETYDKLEMIKSHQQLVKKVTNLTDKFILFEALIMDLLNK